LSRCAVSETFFPTCGVRDTPSGPEGLTSFEEASTSVQFLLLLFFCNFTLSHAAPTPLFLRFSARVPALLLTRHVALPRVSKRHLPFLGIPLAFLRPLSPPSLRKRDANFCFRKRNGGGVPPLRSAGGRLFPFDRPPPSSRFSLPAF